MLWPLMEIVYKGSPKYLHQISKITDNFICKMNRIALSWAQAQIFLSQIGYRPPWTRSRSPKLNSRKNIAESEVSFGGTERIQEKPPAFWTLGSLPTSRRPSSLPFSLRLECLGEHLSQIRRDLRGLVNGDGCIRHIVPVRARALLYSSVFYSAAHIYPQKCSWIAYLPLRLLTISMWLL